jgi:hypothetical protein
MIDDLDKSLKVLLEQGIEDLDDTRQNVHFDPPDDTFAPVEPAVDLFLYDVRENRELRSNDWQVERNSGTVIKKPPPVRVDCSYLITAWAGDAYSEHRLLGKIMRVLLRHPRLPAEVLQGSLAGQEPPLPTAVLQPGRLQSLGEFWQALGGKPKAALNYTVTIGVPVHEPLEIGPPVTGKQVPGRRED